MEGREETLGSSKVSLAAVHKKTKSPVSNKMEGMHNNWNCPLTFTYMWAHTPQQDDVQKAKWQKTGISSLPGLSVTNSMCRKGHHIHIWERLVMSLVAFERMPLFCSQVYSHSQKHYLFLTVYFYVPGSILCPGNTWTWKSKQVCLGCTLCMCLVHARQVLWSWPIPSSETGFWAQTTME